MTKTTDIQKRFLSAVLIFILIPASSGILLILSFPGHGYFLLLGGFYPSLFGYFTGHFLESFYIRLHYRLAVLRWYDFSLVV